MTIDITKFLKIVAEEVKNKKVPVVDLIAVQTKDPYKVLTATILSARTKDETTAIASARLFESAPSLQDLACLNEKEIEKLIYPVGFFKNKSKYLAELPKALEKFNGIVPDTIEDLLTLPGVGRKTANLVVCVAFQKPAICVDTHVHRITNIWQYVETKTPEQTEKVLREKLPLEHWMQVNSLLVAFGQSICRPIGPHCDVCQLQQECPQFGVTPRKLRQSISKRDFTTKRFISWNVNGIRAAEKKDFINIVKGLSADILGIQETKAQPDQLSDELKNIKGYHAYFHSAEKKGYSGVAVYAKNKPLKVIEGIANDKFDSEGRVLTLEFHDFFFVNIYFPNSASELKRLNFKLEFNDLLQQFVQKLSEKKSVVICGDYNVAHKEIDLKNPKTNTNNAGFTPEERAWMDRFLESGFIDTFRLFDQAGNNYTWWSYRYNARAKNIGWRIDYFCVDKKSEKRVLGAEILSDILGSDHCPVLLDFYVPEII